MRPFLLFPVVLAALSFPITAFAQESASPHGCPNGAWFCSEDDSLQAPQTESATPHDEDETRDPSEWVQHATPEAQTPPVVVVIVPKTAATPAPVSKPAPAHVRLRRVQRGRNCFGEFHKDPPAPTSSTKKSDEPKSGFDIYMQRLIFLDGQTRGSADPDASLVGGGASLRVTARPNLEIHVGNSGLFGKDFNGFERGEIGLSLFAQRHINPESRLRVYTLWGGGIAFGHVESKKASPLLPLESHTGDFYANYGLLTGQAGFGTELRLTSFLSAHLDLLASFRWRFSSTQDAPEYFDQRTGDATNAYPGIVVRGGVTIW